MANSKYLDDLLSQFLEKFPLESLKNMNLEDYTDLVTKETDNDSFTYWVETKTKDLGSIKGGSSEKFGIYKYNQTPTNEIIAYNNTYAWAKKLGVSVSDAWEKVRENIYSVAKFASEGKFQEIDNITILWPGFTWKIAFLYSKKNLINTFKFEALLFLSKDKGKEFPKNTRFSELYDFLMKVKPTNLDFWNYGEQLWNKWNSSEEIISSVFEELIEYYKQDGKFKYCENEQDAFSKKNGGFIWIGSNDNIIGNTNCHYEFIFYNRKLYTEIHFEKDNKENLKKICESMNVHHHKRYKDYYCIDEDAIDIDEEDSYIEKAANALEKLDSLVGMKIKEELLKMSENKQVLVDSVKLLTDVYNLILHGAPGTGKTYLAKDIAAQIIANKNYSELSNEERKQIGFCQFHPSYDYTDFVEGLRPVQNGKTQIGFERKNGLFKEFCKIALENFTMSKKTLDVVKKELSDKEIIDAFLAKQIAEQTIYNTVKNSFFVKNYDDKHVVITYKSSDGIISDDVRLKYSDLKVLFEQNKDIERTEVRKITGRKVERQEDSYLSVLINELRKSNTNEVEHTDIKDNSLRKYVFIIDEINRGELSKIFGELFYSIEPSYRGPKGTVFTQYSNMLDEPNEFDDTLGISVKPFGNFYIPENVYIIGTMNDIDRSVESMDFAMRRRFIFKEVTAEESAENMNITGEALQKMNAINKVISKMPELGKSYCIGAAYFKDAKDLQKLWDLKISSLVYEYLRGIDNYTDEHKDGEKFDEIKSAYDNPDSVAKN